MKMAQSNHRRVAQVRNAEDIDDYRYKTSKDFKLLYKVLLAAGLVFPSLIHKRPICKWIAKIFETIVNVMALFILFVNTVSWQRRYRSVTLHFSTTLTIFFALSVRFVLLLCRAHIPRMMRNLIFLYADTTRKKSYKSLKMPILIGCTVTFFLTITASGLDSHRILVERAKGEHAIQFLIKLNDTDGRYQKWMFRIFLGLVPVKMHFAYGVSLIILIFCSSVYTIAKRIALAFHDQIKRHNRESCKMLLTSDLLSTYLNHYNRITQMVAEIDHVLSPCVLLLYGLMVSGQFYTLTVLISQDTEPTSLPTVLQNVITFLLTTVAFLVLTLTASKMTEIAEDIKLSLQMLSEQIPVNEEQSLSRSGVGNSYLILLSIVNGSYLSFTGWKMFNINRSFILTTMGVMISYGIIIVQMDRKYNNT